MESRNRSARVGFWTILLAVTAILMCALPCSALDILGPVTIPSEGYPSPVTENVYVRDGGVLNLLPDGEIAAPVNVESGGTLNLQGVVSGGDVYALGGSEVNIHGGDLTEGWWIIVTASADVTVFGTEFAVTDGTINSEGTSFTADWGICSLTGTYEPGVSIALTFYVYDVATPISLAAPSTGPVPMLEDLGLCISDQVAQYQEPIPPDVELIGIAPELEASLVAKVDAALAALAKGNSNDAKVAMNDMKAVVNQVLAQTDKKISIEASDSIQRRADAIISALGG